jgi:hypothetical protein
MGKVIELSALTKKQPKRQELIMTSEAGTDFSIQQLEEFDYRGVFRQACDKLKRTQKLDEAYLIQQPIRIIDIAYGALIAQKLKHDKEAVDTLFACFQKYVIAGQHYGTLADLPEFVRGYVWSYHSVLMAFAKASISPGVRL